MGAPSPRSSRRIWGPSRSCVPSRHKGFADHSHLKRHFRRVVGITPFRYRRAGRPPPRELEVRDLVVFCKNVL